MQMMSNLLFIVEGETDEPTVLGSVFERYGFKVIRSAERMSVDTEDSGLQFEKFQYATDRSNVVIIQGPRTRIHDFLKAFKENEMSLERAFSYAYSYFKGIFLIFDVDHNDCEDVEEMYRRFGDESSGMLLLSSPCFEVLADFDHDRKEETYHRIHEYKAAINEHHKGRTLDFMVDHFPELLLFFLEKNRKEFQEDNVMEHPRLIVESINRLNERVNCREPDQSYVVYRYFSTVLYVAIAYANGLTKEVRNYEAVREFFLKSPRPTDR